MNDESGNAVPFVAEGEVPSTSQFNFLSGAFDVGSWRVPYFATTMSFREAAEDLRLTTEMPGSHQIRWTVGELYQRDIDWRRVQNDLVKYLSDNAQPQFFNSLTIALFPHVPESSDRVRSFNEQHAWQPPKLIQQDRYQKVVDVGPVKLGFFGAWEKVSDPGFLMGSLRWNSDQVHGVAIDGQHRLAAIKETVRRRGAGASRVPVLLLLLDPRVGFMAPGEPDMTSVMRTLFIDLNKHARRVSRARQILLDDREPISRCVRAFLADQLNPDTESLGHLPPRMPLGLIDWHSEQAKFGSGPYLSTVLGIDEAVGLLLSSKPIADPTSFGQLERQIRRYAHRLRVDLGSALERLAENVERQSPFSFSDVELTRISDGFAAIWNEPLIRLFTDFAPYRQFLELRQRDGSLSLEWQQWFKLDQAAKGAAAGHSITELNQFLDELGLAEQPIFKASLEARAQSHDAYKKDNLAFAVAFQRAYFAAFSQFLQFTDNDLDQFSEWVRAEQPDLDDVEEYGSAEVDVDRLDEFDADDDDELGSGVLEGAGALLSASSEVVRASQFLHALNRVVECVPGLLNVDGRVSDESAGGGYFWAGSLRRPEGEIDFTLGASTRAADLLFLCASLGALHVAIEDEAVDFDTVWAELTDGSEWPPFRKMWWASRRLWEKEGSMAARVLAATDQEFSRAKAQGELELRLRAVWNLIRE